MVVFIGIKLFSSHKSNLNKSHVTPAQNKSNPAFEPFIFNHLILNKQGHSNLASPSLSRFLVKYLAKPVLVFFIAPG